MLLNPVRRQEYPLNNAPVLGDSSKAYLAVFGVKSVIIFHHDYADSTINNERGLLTSFKLLSCQID